MTEQNKYSTTPRDYTHVGPMPQTIATGKYLGKVDSTSQLLARDIRNFAWAEDTQESIARFIEWCSILYSFTEERNDIIDFSVGQMNTMFSDVIKELSKDKDYHSLPEIAVARRGYSTLFESLRNLSVNMLNPNLGKLTQVHLSDELLAQIAGNTAVNAVPADGSLVTEKYADNSVTSVKTNFFTNGKNLFNPETSESSVVLNGLGGTQANENYEATDYISVNVGDYAVTNARNVAVYDDNKVFLNFVDILPVGNRIVNITNTGYIRASYTKEDVNRFMIEKGSHYTRYEPYKDFLVDKVKLTEKNIEGVIPFGMTDIAVKKNLFNPETRLIGYIINEYGDAIQTGISVNYDVSDFIPVDVGSYSITENRNVAIYDGDKNLIDFIQPGGTDERTIEVTQTGFIRVSFLKEHVNQAMVLKGTSIGTTYYSPDDYVLNEQIHIEKNNEYVSKKGLHFGDSITANGTLIDKIKSLTGYDIFNAAIGGTRLVDLEASNIYTKLSFCNLLRAITSGDWSVIDNAVDSINNSALTQKVADLKQIDFSTLDYVAFMYGTNDINNANIELGEPNSSDTTTTNGAMNFALSTLMSEFPNLRVFVFAPIFRPKMPTSDPVQNSDDFSISDIYLYDIANAMGERAKEFKTPFKNMYYESGINKHNSYYYIGDGTHPNGKGDALLAEVIGRFITSN